VLAYLLQEEILYKMARKSKSSNQKKGEVFLSSVPVPANSRVFFGGGKQLNKSPGGQYKKVDFTFQNPWNTKKLSYSVNCVLYGHLVCINWGKLR
jgi:hypothetical protein